MGLRAPEWIAAVYFVYLAAVSVFMHLPAHQRRRVLGGSTAVVASIAGISVLDGGTATTIARDWLPTVYLLLGYWLPAACVVRTNPVVEQKLLAIDRRWLGGRGPALFAQRAPRLVTGLLELMYLLCYPLVPAGLTCLYVAGFRNEADRYWTAVLLAVFCCYGLLPWLPTRPPRAIEPDTSPAPGLIRRFNIRVLNRASIQLNTFPSGHAAASMAAALAVTAVLPAAGAVLGLIALGISIGSVVGRYHYAADAVAGVVLAFAGFTVSRLV